jgi:hypothetical protein
MPCSEHVEVKHSRAISELHFCYLPSAFCLSPPVSIVAHPATKSLKNSVISSPPPAFTSTEVGERSVYSRTLNQAKHQTEKF